MNIKKWATSFVALLCLLCLTVGLFAGCNSVDSKVEVVFDMNWKEAPSTPESIEVTEGKPYGQLPQIADNLREGYTFGGWYLDSDCDGEEVTAETVVESSVDHVLYAKWIGKEVTVSFDLQGGTINGVSNVEDVVVKVGNVYSMMAIPEDPDKENSSFMGWYYDPEGTEGPVRTSTKVEKTEDHTLYAVWQEYKLFYDFENGTGLELFAAAGNIQYGIEQYNGSNQLNIANPGTDKADGTALQMWIPLKAGTRVTMDLTFAGELPTQDARMYMFAYGLNASGIAITDGVLDIKESETHRKWYHGNGYRAMQKGGTWYYGDEGNWQEGNTCKFEMIVMEDCAGLYLMFCLGDKLEPAQFAPNDIYIDNIEFTPNYYRSLGEGMMGSSPYGATDKGIYFTMKKNDMPYDSDWKVYYDATSANNVKVIRNGKVYRIAQTDCDNIVKFSETDYYLRLEEYTIGAAAPISKKDIFIVEGNFRYGKNTLTIKKTYIYYDGVSWVCADYLPEELAPASEKTYDLPDPYAGILRPHEGGATDSGIHFKLSDNGLPFNADWSVYYDATSADNVKIIRDGKVYRAAQVGCDNICKFGKADYYLRLENYTIGGYWPFTTEDIFIVEGEFQYEDSILDINKTYIYHNGTDWVFATKLPAELAPETEEPVEPEEIADGVMGSNPNGATDQGIYFTMKDNGLPFNADWSVYYDATSADNIKVIRNGATYPAAVVGCDNICKFSATDYYLRLENYTIGGYAPFSTADIFVVEGDFTYEESTLTIVKTYIYHDGTSWVFAAELPEDLQPGEGGGEELGSNLGVLSAHTAGVAKDAGDNITGIYATGAATNAPFNTDWSVEYTPAAAGNYQLIRDGVTYDVGVTGNGTLVLFGQTELYLKQEGHTFGDGTLLPIRDGDVLVVKGEWTCTSDASAKVTIDTTYILIGEGAVTFSATEPDVGGGEEEKNYNLGVLSANAGGVSTNGDGNINGIYATGTAVDAPCNGDWSVEYAPAAAENYKLIRGGVSYNVGIPGQGTFVLINQTDLYLKQEAWTVSGELLPLQNGDVLVVEGQWTCTSDASAAVTIETTYILIGEGAVTFSATEPDVGGGEGEEIADGVMGSSPNGATDSGIYFTMKDNGLPYGDWNVYYDAISADNIKIIRDGVTYPAAQVGCDNICKFTATDYYLKLENYTIGSYAPFSTADIFVVEGDFTYEDSTLTIVKTYIYHNGTSWVFAAELPEDLQPGEGGEGEVAGLSAHTAGVNIDTTTNSIKGIYAVCADNSATFNSDWSVEYTPAAAENYKLIRDGVTYNVGVPGNGTIVLFGQTELYLKQEGHVFGDGTLLPIQNGDILVVEGQWNCIQDASSTLTIDKTYILISEGTATFSATEPDVGGGEGKAAGLSAHTAGVNIDTTTNSIKGIYAVCADNSATFNSDWSVEYTPAAAENYKLIRDGVTYNVGVTGQGTVVLFGQTELYLKQEGHTFGDGTLLPIRDGDILVVEGQWNCIQDASSSLTIDTTYIIVSDNTVTFAAELPESTLPEEDEVQLSFNFNDGTVSEDVFKLRDSDLTMTVEELNGSNQLRLKPTVKNGTYWLWLDQDLKAGTVITMDVTFNRKLGTKAMSLYLYGAKENGDPITEGTVSGTVPQSWFDGQGVEGDFTNGKVNTQTVTFTVYEDCHGIACMTNYGDQTTNLIYLDNIAKQNSSEEN